MTGEDPALRRYRRFLVAFILAAAVLATALGVWMIWRGKAFYALLALLVVAFLALLLQGYRADERERNP